VNTFNSSEYIFDVDAQFALLLQFVCEYIQKDLGIRLGIDLSQILLEQLLFQLVGICQVDSISLSEWSDIPLILDKDFFRVIPEVPSLRRDNDNLFCFRGGRNVLGHPLVSEKLNVVLTQDQWLLNATHVIAFLDKTRTQEPCYMLAPVILWAILHGEISIVAHMLLSWMQQWNKVRRLATRALHRENWTLLLEWFEMLTYKEADMAWVILRKFLVDVPKDAASRIDGLDPQACGIAQALYGIDLTETCGQQVLCFWANTQCPPVQ